MQNFKPRNLETKVSSYLINKNKQQMLKLSLKNLIKVLYFIEEKKTYFSFMYFFITILSDFLRNNPEVPKNNLPSDLCNGR